MNLKRIRYFLHNFEALKKEIAGIEEDLVRYRSMSTHSFRVNTDPDVYKQTNHDSIGGSTHNSSSYTETLVVTRSLFIDNLERELLEKKSIVLAINCVQGYLDEKGKRLMYLRYARHKSWVAVGIEMGYTQEYCQKVEGRIIKAIIDNYMARVK